jgi:hypothetical protein
VSESSLSPEVIKPQKPAKFPLIIIILFLSPLLILAGLVIYSVVDYYVISPIIEKNMLPAQYIYHKLGAWNEKKPEKSGIVEITGDIDKGVYNIEYNYFPLDSNNLDSEIGIKTATAFIGSFTKNPPVTKLNIIVNGPHSDKYKNTIWMPYVSFALNRDTIAKVNYNNFHESELLTIADNVYYPLK